MTQPVAPPTTRHAVGLGDLLRALSATQPTEWPWVAAALGWPDAAQAELARLAQAAKDARPPETEGGREVLPQPPAPPPPPPPPPPGPPPAQEVPRQVFWRVASDLLDPAAQTEAPDWVNESETAQPSDFESDPDARPPAAVPLVRPGQAASFLRRHLARQRPSAGVDVAQVLRALERQQPLVQVPRRMQSRWPARVQLVYDAQPALGPLHDDLRDLADQIARRLGPRLALYVAHGLPGRWTDATGHPVPGPSAGAVTVVLGDAGLMQAEPAAAAHWNRFARLCAAGGSRPLLLAPVPRRLAQRSTAAAFDTVLLGAGRAMRAVRPARLPAMPGTGAAIQAAASLPVPDGAIDLAQGPASDAASLRAAIYGNPWVTPTLLRALRLALEAHGHPVDVGSEAELWRGPGVSAHELACTLQAEHRSQAAAHFMALPKPLRDALVALHWQHLQGASPLQRAEYARALQPLLAAEPADDATRLMVARGIQAADDLSRKACRVLARQPGALAQLLAGYLSRLGRRRPEQVTGDDEALQAAWVLAHRQALAEASIQPLPGLDMARVAWALAGDGADAPGHALGVAGLPPESVGGLPRWALAMHEQSVDRPLSGQALLSDLASRWTQVRLMLPQLRDSGVDDWLAEGRPVALDASCKVELRNGARISVIEPFTKPDWALAIRFDAGQWQALTADGRWLLWLPGWRHLLGLGRLSQPSAWLRPGGVWVDHVQGRGLAHFDDAYLTRPSWASAHGLDAQGPWADFAVPSPLGPIAQRMRWIPPGEFWMGSPASEPDRSSDETRHRVLLTQGYWLADTACTQALWQAVMGDNPSNFQDDPDNPVEQVSWDDITQRFLPELNRLVPGLAAVLPTEAQWEYACRAGTETPFWIGDQITPEQVNYDGNYPYADGPKGEYRGRTVPVKALPSANGWGLHQMHGNVYEWCADEYGDYPDGTVLDPKGPAGPQGQKAADGVRQRVLRGGSWFDFGRRCRSAGRRALEPVDRSLDFGFRLARGLAEPAAGPEAQAGGAGGLGRAEPAELPPRAERGAAPKRPFRDTGTLGKKPRRQ